MGYVVSTRWYLDKPEGAGPFSISELYRLLEISEAGPQDRVQAEGSTEWVTVSEVLQKAGESVVASATPAAKSPPRPPRANYIIRHWRGDLSLGVSYWVNLSLLSGVTTAAILLAAELSE